MRPLKALPSPPARTSRAPIAPQLSHQQLHRSQGSCFDHWCPVRPGLVALGGDDEQLEKDNNKRYIDGVGTMSLSITKVDPETGEFAGVFSAIQTSDSDMGGREVVDIKITGELYGRLEEAWIHQFS